MCMFYHALLIILLFLDIFFWCVCAYTHTHICMCNSCTLVYRCESHLCGDVDAVRCLPMLLSTMFFETESLNWNFLISARLSSQWFPRILLVFPPQCWDFRCMALLPAFLWIQFRSSCLHARCFSDWASPQHCVLPRCGMSWSKGMDSEIFNSYYTALQECTAKLPRSKTYHSACISYITNCLTQKSRCHHRSLQNSYLERMCVFR